MVKGGLIILIGHAHKGNKSQTVTEIYMNLFIQRPPFGSATFIKNISKVHNTKVSRVSTLSSSVEGILIVSWTPRPTLKQGQN